MTDLVDHGERGVDEHQVARVERQVMSLLQSEQHRSDQRHLGGALIHTIDHLRIWLTVDKARLTAITTKWKRVRWQRSF